jgi:hypothetical protein
LTDEQVTHTSYQVAKNCRKKLKVEVEVDVDEEAIAASAAKELISSLHISSLH